MQTPELSRRGDYGYDAPRQGMMPTGAGALFFLLLSAIHLRNRRAYLAGLELVISAFAEGKLLAWTCGPKISRATDPKSRSATSSLKA